MSVTKYQSALSRSEAPRETEYRLFALVTKALMTAEERGEKGRPFIEAVDWNRRLWLTLQMDLASDDNAFPDELRAQLISVAIWVDRHSSAALRGEARVGPLINVNRTIMEGLAQIPGQVGEAAAEAGTTSA